MKQFVFLLLFFAGTIFSVFSQTDVKLELKLKKGDTYLIENNIASVTEQDIMGEKQIIQKNEFSSFIFSVINKKSNAPYYIQIRYKHFKTEIDAQNHIEIIDTDSINYDSALSKFYSYLINKSFYLKVNTQGEILKVDSLNNLLDLDIINELDVYTGIMLRKQFEEEAIKNMHLLTLLPKNIIQEKKTWNNTDTSQINILNIYNTKYILQETTDETYIINNTSQIFTDKNESLKVNNLFINYHMKGNSISSNVLDKSSCMIKELTTTQYVSGTAGMKYSEDSENAYTWPIKITNTISVKAYKIEK